jgi:Flp pilus assembly pilin Flp
MGRSPKEARMLNYLRFWLGSLRQDDEGQTLVEYALILVLVSLGSIVALEALGGQISAVFDEIVTDLGF